MAHEMKNSYNRPTVVKFLNPGGTEMFASSNLHYDTYPAASGFTGTAWGV